jgi:hypothetical protein
MAVINQTPYTEATGNGVTTVFPFNWLTLEKTDLSVYLDGVLKTVDVDYTVTGLGNVNGGQLTFLTAPASSVKVTIIRTMPRTRSTDYQNLGDFNADTVDADVDRVVLLVQDLHAQLNRMIRAPTYEVTSLNQLPPAAARANSLLGFNAAGQPEAVLSLGVTVISQSVIGALLYPQTDAEIAASATIVNYHLKPGEVERYGNNATPGTSDMTTALNKAIAVAQSSGVRVKLPPVRIKISDQPTSLAGQMTLEGDGPFKSRIDLIPTVDDKAALKLANGASRCERVILRDFAIWSSDTTYRKIGLDLYDLSVCKVERVFIFGTGGAGPSAGACFSGNNSIGIRTHGREATGVEDVEIIADRCIVIAANPNTAANDGEDMDHWNWHNLYLVGNGNALIEVDAGLGIMETSFDGYQAWVGGTKGFKINDTRAAPIVSSRGIRFQGVRHEQITDAAGYTFDLTFTVPVQQIAIEDTLIGAGGHAITINGFETMVLKNVTSAVAAAKNSLVTAGVIARSCLLMEGCNWQSGSVLTLTGLNLIAALAFRSADRAGPTHAVYAGQITDTLVNVALLIATCANGATGLRVTGTTGDRMSVNPQAAGSGIQIRSENNAGSDYEPAAVYAETFNVHTRTGVGTVAEALRADASTTAGQTRLLVYDVDNATLERVTVGAADSGGAGFKVLRIPN